MHDVAYIHGHASFYGHASHGARVMPGAGTLVSPKYDLDPDRLAGLQEELVDTVRDRAGCEGITAVWLGPEQTDANIIRTHEARLFPEVLDSSPGDESKTLFLALVDTRPASSRVVHGATVCGPEALNGVRRGRDARPGPGRGVSTGFITVDNLIDLGNFSSADFERYYAAANIDLTRCGSVETNFRIGQRVPKAWGLSTRLSRT